MGPYILNAEPWELHEQCERLIAQLEPLRRKGVCSAKAAVRERRNRRRILRAALPKGCLNLCARQRSERDAYSTRTDGRQDGIVSARYKKKEHLTRWLLDGLEEAICRRLIHRIRAVDEDDAPPSRDGCARGCDEDVAYRLRADHRRTLAARLRCGLEIVRMNARRHRTARIAVPAGGISCAFAEECPCKHACRTPLSDPLHPAQQQRMGQVFGSSKRAQTADDVRMSAHVRPVARELLPHRIIAERSGHRQRLFRLCHHI